MLQESANSKKFFAIEECTQRWGLSRWTVIRRADEGAIKTVYFGSRRLIPAPEVERIEREGLPAPRKTKTGGTKRSEVRVRPTARRKTLNAPRPASEALDAR
jgi:hypothetical protein